MRWNTWDGAHDVHMTNCVFPAPFARGSRRIELLNQTLTTHDIQRHWKLPSTITLQATPCNVSSGEIALPTVRFQLFATGHSPSKSTKPRGPGQALQASPGHLKSSHVKTLTHITTWYHVYSAHSTELYKFPAAWCMAGRTWWRQVTIINFVIVLMSLKWLVCCDDSWEYAKYVEISGQLAGFEMLVSLSLPMDSFSEMSTEIIQLIN